MAPEKPKGTSSFFLWLEDALPGWLLPVGLIVAAGAVAGLYWTERLSQRATGAIIILAGLAAAIFFMLKAAFDRPEASIRGFALLAIALTALVAGFPALRTVMPGDPIFSGDMGLEGDTIPVPAGVSGRLRLLVHGKLKENGGDKVEFTITGAKEPVEGELQRITGYARVGRSGRTRVTTDINSDYLSTVIPAGTKELKLDSVKGQLGSRLSVKAYHEYLPKAGTIALAIATLFLCAFVDARMAQKGNFAILGGIALGFGLLLQYNATPDNAVGPALGAVILGAVIGSLAASMATWVVRKFVQPLPRIKAKAAAPAEAASKA